MKIASRYLLPIEMFLSIVMISWGLSGWVGGGLLWRTLHDHGMNDEFGVVLCLAGLVHLVVSSLEWFFGRRWSCAPLLASVTARYWLAFLAGVIWLYVGHIILTLKWSGSVVALIIQVPAALVFLTWIFVGNRKTACLLDPTVPTKRLQGEICAEREEAFKGH